MKLRRQAEYDNQAEFDGVGKKEKANEGIETKKVSRQSPYQHR